MISFSLGWNENVPEKTCCGGILPRDLYVTCQGVLNTWGSSAALREKKSGGAEKHAQAQLDPWMQKRER
jgi:hypothetical protein